MQKRFAIGGAPSWIGRSLLVIGGLGKSLRIIPVALRLTNSPLALVWTLAVIGLLWGIIELWSGVQAGKNTHRSRLASRIGAALLLLQGMVLVVFGVLIIARGVWVVLAERSLIGGGVFYLGLAILFIWAALGLLPARRSTETPVRLP